MTLVVRFGAVDRNEKSESHWSACLLESRISCPPSLGLPTKALAQAGLQRKQPDEMPPGKTVAGAIIVLTCTSHPWQAFPITGR